MKSRSGTGRCVVLNPTHWQRVAEGDLIYFQYTDQQIRIACSTVGSTLDFLDRFKPVLLEQIHSAAIIDIDHEAGRIGDGLTTSCHRLAIGIKNADCLPVFLYNEQRAVAIHCGWRSLRAGIVQNAARLLNNFRYVLAASIGPCCYEIGDDVAESFRRNHPDAVVKRGFRQYLDLKKCVRSILGAEPVADLDLCVKCHPELFFSFRRGDTDRRNYAIAIREK